MFYAPTDVLLQELVAGYWFIDAHGIPHNTKMLPDGYGDIMINLGEPYSLVLHDGATRSVEGSAVFGQRTKPLLLQQPGDVRMIGIRMLPGSEYAFTGIRASLLVNSFTPLPDINATINELLQQLKATTVVAEQIKILETLLLALLHKDVGTTVAIKVAGIVRSAKGNIAVDDVAAQAGLSYKQLERLFSKHVGISPKMFARVHRFHNAFTQVRALQKANWMQVLHNCGYYDQAHFIKDFSFFSGVSPTRQFTAKDTLDDFFGFA